MADQCRSNLGVIGARLEHGVGPKQRSRIGEIGAGPEQDPPVPGLFPRILVLGMSQDSPDTEYSSRTRARRTLCLEETRYPETEVIERRSGQSTRE
jgi:hypothetical protein